MSTCVKIRSMGTWAERKELLEKLQERTSGDLTEGQAGELNSLLEEVIIAESEDRVRPGKILRIAKGLFNYGGLKEPELADFIKDVSPRGRRISGD